MCSSTFIFATWQFDDDFHRLGQAIHEYIGEETWKNASTGLISNVLRP